MAVKIMKQGYYQRSMHRDAAKVIQDCEKCKEQHTIRRMIEYNAITTRSVWRFNHWGVNILGPLLTDLGGFKFLAIAVKHSTKCLTYDSKGIIPISENNVAKDDRGMIKEVDKRTESKEVASIEEAYYQNKLRKHHNQKK
nr:hypothetical protein [Tanacetum cinerariifolium]